MDVARISAKLANRPKGPVVSESRTKPAARPHRPSGMQARTPCRSRSTPKNGCTPAARSVPSEKSCANRRSLMSSASTR
eukprot:2765363-Prymnesium_polylepis.1